MADQCVGNSIGAQQPGAAMCQTPGTCEASCLFRFARCNGAQRGLLLGALLGLLEPVRLPLDGDDLTAVHQAVDQRDHASGVGEHLVPLAKRLIGRHHRDSSCLIDLRNASLLDAFVLLPYELLIPNTLLWPHRRDEQLHDL